MSIRFDGRVAIVTGGGNGLGREYCLKLAERGAKVVVNDLGGSLDGVGGSSTAADRVVDEIRRAGGHAIANTADITNLDQVNSMVADAASKWGRVDILINNAGILRDKTFAKMSMEDFKKVVDVHLFGSANCTKAVWDTMREQQYGRILFTSSSSGLFGNFGQANYGAAKAAMLGLMNVLHLEGRKYGIHANMLAPTAATRMLDGLLPEEVKDLMAPELVAPGVLYLVSDEAPSRTILGAGAGCFSTIRLHETAGVFVGGKSATVDDIAAHWAEITDERTNSEPTEGADQTNGFIAEAAKALGIDLTSKGFGHA